MAEFRGFIKGALFLSSYIPLYVILVFDHWGYRLNVNDIPRVDGDVLGFTSIPILSLFWLLMILIPGTLLYTSVSIRKSKEPKWTDIESCTSRNDLITSYILVYIFPFVVLDYSELTNWLAFLIFFAVIGIIQVRSNQLHVNPVLSLFSYDIYEVDTGDDNIMLLSKEKPTTQSDPIKTVELSNDVHISL